MNILIIEDEPAIADTLIHVLEMDGYDSHWVASGGEGLTYLRQQHADLVVLDVGLPDVSGFELCKTIRGFSDIPIIFLTARDDVIDRVVGLEIGADDYVTKPFSPREVLARIKLRIRPRAAEAHSTTTTDGELISHNFDFNCNGQPLGLTAVEFKILSKLIEAGPRVLSREQLMIAADMAADAVYERNIDSHIKAIRQKLKPAGHDARLHTKRGFGYYYQRAAP
ncbi:response regulator [Ferrimonas sp. SCSIO 43195]|uniref:response regulator n=1 Tax=Ferrimonas sp. SCSIO 43195 TaxID=2822844 RepID=UPI0020761C92|nr:response regulator [Ferrimonas sp. SCSIO 43195]USD38730.1 response regulator [Ferrimonas sp. SCSIO 43195]